MNKALWQPSEKRIRESSLEEFLKFVSFEPNKNFKDFWKWRCVIDLRRWAAPISLLYHLISSLAFILLVCFNNYKQARLCN